MIPLLLLSHAAFAGDLLDPTLPVDPFEPPTLAPRIVNGDPASDEVYPATGGLILEGRITTPPFFGPSQTVDLLQLGCSSTLIAPDVVLAAAHCVDPAVIAQGGTAEELGFWWSRKADLSEPNAPGDELPRDAVRVASTAVPANWSIDVMQDFAVADKKYDIALLFLEEPVFDVDPAILVNEDEALAIEPGLEVDIVGWGLQTAATLFDSFIPQDPSTYARKQWGTTRLAEVGEFEFQVGDRPDAPRKCKGDSGGPTFMEVADATTADPMRLIGVTSRSADFTLCATLGGYDTRVDGYLGWIDSTMREACDDGDRVWCDEPGILTGAPAEEEKRGCDSAGGPPVGWLGLLGLLGLRRRR